MTSTHLRRRSLRVLALLVSAFAVAASLAGPATARDKVYRVQLDSDRARERVVVQKRRCRNLTAYGCSRLVLRDGKRRRVLTNFTQRPRYPYAWVVARVRFVDFTGDGIKEILWRLDTSGGTVSSPSLRGVHRWNGRSKRRIFRFANARTPPPGYSFTVFVSSRLIRGGPLPEIKTRESLHTENDANCCPSAYRIMRHRWNGRRIAPVPGSEVIEPA
jgi:hypothetical protein